jgi:simple sugar transport system substrate-binding protein
LDKHNISYGPEGDIIMISFDALHEAFEKMIEGKQHLSVECNPLLAANVEDVILKLERGETLEKMYYTEEGVFSYVDAAQYIDERAY